MDMNCHFGQSNHLMHWWDVLNHNFRHFDNVQLTQSVKHMQKYRGNEYELKISRVKMEDKGEYVVKAENSFGRREELGILKVDRKSTDL